MYNHNKPHGVPLAKPVYPSVSKIRNNAADVEFNRELKLANRTNEQALLDLLKD